MQNPGIVIIYFNFIYLLIPINNYYLYTITFISTHSHWLSFCSLFFPAFPWLIWDHFPYAFGIPFIVYLRLMNALSFLLSEISLKNFFWDYFLGIARLAAIFLGYFEDVIPLLAGFHYFHWEVSCNSYFALLKEMYPFPLVIFNIFFSLIFFQQFNFDN